MARRGEGVMKRDDVWHVTREYAGLAEAGGLKDVPKGLAKASCALGLKVAVILPFYGFITHEQRQLVSVLSCQIFLGEEAHQVQIFRLTDEGVTIYLVASHCFQNKNLPYTYRNDPAHSDGIGHQDSHEMNLILQKSVIVLAHWLGAPKVVHLHDGHTAYLPAMVAHLPIARVLKASAFLLTIHNGGVGYHQSIPHPAYASLLTGLPLEVINQGLVYGMSNPLALASAYAIIITVSPAYANDLMSVAHSAQTGGLSVFFAEHKIKVLGIYNGVDLTEVDARQGAGGCFLPYDPLNNDEVLKHKQWLYQELLTYESNEHCWVHGTLPAQRNQPVFSWQGRFVAQKGVDVLMSAIREVLAHTQALFVVMGQGDSELEQQMIELTHEPQVRGHVLYIQGYETCLSKKIVALGDFFLLSSLYEPCGLSDLYAMAMGTIPIGHATGGLLKTMDGKTGLLYSPLASLSQAIERAITEIYNDNNHFFNMRQAAYCQVCTHFSWDGVMKEHYLLLYRQQGV
jgi:starch synthase